MLTFIKLLVLLVVGGYSIKLDLSSHDVNLLAVAVLGVFAVLTDPINAIYSGLVGLIIGILLYIPNAWSLGDAVLLSALAMIVNKPRFMLPYSSAMMIILLGLIVSSPLLYVFMVKENRGEKYFPFVPVLVLGAWAAYLLQFV